MVRGPRAVAETLALFGGVFAVELLAPLVGLGAGAFALSLPLAAAPWTLVTSVYAHASVGHLLANAAALLALGWHVARRTSRARFHAFFLGAGSVAGVATVVLASALGSGVAVVGASGAVLALAGYLLAGNLVTRRLLGRVTLSRRQWTVVVAGLAAAVAITTGGPGVALTAHVTGFLLGLGAGRRRLLQVG